MNELGGLVQPAFGTSEPPNMENKKDPSWAGSLKSFPNPDDRDLSPAEAMVYSAI